MGLKALNIGIYFIISGTRNFDFVSVRDGFLSFFTRQSIFTRIVIARISYGNYVRLSVYLSRPGTDTRPGEIETSGFQFTFYHMIA